MMDVEESHQQDEAKPAAKRSARTAEGKLESESSDNFVVLPEESHHLDCFDYCHIATQATLTRSSPPLRMTTSAKPSSTFKRQRLEPSSSSLQRDTCKQCQPEQKKL